MTDEDLELEWRVPHLWVMVSTEILAVVGLAISTYLTIAHFIGTQALACSDTGIINCAKVTTSAQSEFLGIPVAVLGLGYYVVAVIFYSPWVWHSSNRLVHVARLAFSIMGMLFVLWLLTAEFVIIKNICIWCTAVHVVTFSLFVITMLTAPVMLPEIPIHEPAAD